MRYSIQKRLRRMLLTMSSAALLFAVGSLVSYEIYAFRKSHRQDISTIAAVMAYSCNSSLTFQDHEDAESQLESLRAEPTIGLAVIYDAAGKIFAAYPTNISRAVLPPSPARDGSRYSGGKLEVVLPIATEKRVGTLYIQAELTPLYSRLQVYSLLVAVVLGISFLMVWLLSFWLQRRVTEPILELAGAASRVTQKNDFSIRATRRTDDEVGGLTTAFNTMLAEIGKRDLALRESEERFRNMADAAPVLIWTSGADKGFDYVNREWLQFTGRPFEADLGKGWLESVPLEDREACWKAYSDAFEARREFEFEHRLRRADGELRFVRNHGSPRFAQDGAFRGYIGSCMDITDIRQSQLELERRVERRTSELAETNRELEAFTYSVSHDLRAPLRHINAYAQVLEEDYGPKLEPEARNYLDRIQSGAARMGLLVDDLLNLARVGRQELVFHEISIDEIVNEVIQEIRCEIASREIDWKVGKLGTVQGDRVLLKQVFTNLISNAVKYSRPRARAVIEIGRIDNGNGVVYFVRDNGVGFDMKYAAKLFGVFQRLHRNEDFEGTGVGLAIVDRIIRRHGGRIRAEAAPDKGATFYFTLGQETPAS